jgi:hypothetical protein
MEALIGFNMLVMDLHLWQRRVIIEWRNSDVVMDNAVSSGVSAHEPVVTNSNGMSTFMPSYGSYIYTWCSSRIGNPLDLDWLRYTVYEQVDAGYIKDVIDIMEDQTALWGTAASNGSFAFGAFCTYVDRLKVFYEYLTYRAALEKMGLVN